MESESKRVRAWVMVTAKKPYEFSAELAKNYRDEERGHEFGLGGKALVVVRADVVDGDKVNVVVPVDAVSRPRLDEFVNEIEGYGVTNVTILQVKENGHHPNPPHKSSTYVTWDELREDPVVDYFPAGRHPNSPGRNAWG